MAKYITDYVEINEKLRHVYFPQYKCDLCDKYFYAGEFSYSVDLYYTKICICNNCNKVVNNIPYKKLFKDLFNSSCSKCGYNKCDDILEYHHVDDILKTDTVSSFIKERNINKIITELNKCTLLCNNCHVSHHKGVWTAKFKKLELGYKVVKPTIRYKK